MAARSAVSGCLRRTPSTLPRPGPRAEPLEVLARHVDFAAHFENYRGLVCAQPARNRANRIDVVRDVLADFAVAARRCDCKAPRFVAQADRESVELELRDVLEGRR